MKKLAYSVLGVAALSLFSHGAVALTVTQTTDGTVLRNALVTNPGEFGSITASYAVGNSTQVGTYSGFNSPPVTIGDGVVMSTGHVVDTVGPYNNAVSGGLVSTDFGGGSTPEIEAYSAAHDSNWASGHDAAVLQLDFSLANPSAIAFNFILGSVEYPLYAGYFVDPFHVFLDGAPITFDALGEPAQLGKNFAAQLRTNDTNTIFTGVGANAGNDAHALFDILTTRSGTLGAGNHTIRFEIADAYDGQYDSAVFISDFRLTTNPGAPHTDPIGAVPEPSNAALLAVGAALIGMALRRRADPRPIRIA